MEHIKEFKEFIKNYIKKYSEFELEELVVIKKHGPPRNPYKITNIKVDDFGNILYEVTSPRTNSSMPISFNVNDLEPYDAK